MNVGPQRVRCALGDPHTEMAAAAIWGRVPAGSPEASMRIWGDSHKAEVQQAVKGLEAGAEAGSTGVAKGPENSVRAVGGAVGPKELTHRTGRQGPLGRAVEGKAGATFKAQSLGMSGSGDK